VGLARLSLVLAFGALQGCSRPERTRPWTADDFEPRADEHVMLQVVLPRDTVDQGYPGAVEVFYYVVNGAEPMTLDNRPERWQVRLETQDGRPVAPTVVSSPATGMLGDTRLMLPARGILGQVVNLRCIRDGAGYVGDPTEREECLGFYDLDRAGVYRVILEYTGPDHRVPVRDSASVSTDTATRGGSRSEPGTFQMADTATLVVTAQ
jgi:hypothetical protein